MESVAEKIVLGIDPGTNLLGYGIISESAARKHKILAIGVLKLDKTEDHGERLGQIYKKIESLIVGFGVNEVAIEAPFYGKNVQSMLKLGRAQGVAIVAAKNSNLPVFEYEPRRIKQSITGSGSASKQQIAAMLQKLLAFEEKPETLDATDAVAVALCHLFQFSPMQFGVKKSGKKNAWANFVSDHPDKVL